VLLACGSINYNGIMPDFLVNLGIQQDYTQGIDGIHASQPQRWRAECVDYGWAATKWDDPWLLPRYYSGGGGSL
jgi:hypothetical protein